MAFIKVLLFALATLAAVEAAIAPRAFRGLLQSGKYTDAEDCVCMNWRNCRGEINSDVQCSPSYLKVCCIQPKPEPIPEYIPEVERVQ